MLARIERKLAEIQRWVDSVYGVADVPAALALAMYRTRPASTARLIRVRPAKLRGLAIVINAASLSDFVIYEEVFIDGVYDLAKMAFAPDAIVDCGAYHGYFSLLAAATFPGVRVTAFEPNAANVAALNRNISENGLDVDVRPSAVSSRDGTAAFSGDGCGGHLSDDAGGGVTVRLTNLCRVIAELRSEALLLKLDVEGEEQQLLPAVINALPRRCAIFFEWHHDQAGYQSIAGLLASHGFITTITRENRVDDRTIYIDAVAQR